MERALRINPKKVSVKTRTAKVFKALIVLERWKFNKIKRISRLVMFETIRKRCVFLLNI